MKIECKDLEFVFRQGDPELMEALELHAEQCLACRRQMNEWKELSRAALALHGEWESPDLWLRIRADLASATNEASRPRPPSRAVADSVRVHWRALAVAATLLILSTSSVWFVLRQPEPDGERPQQVLLTNNTLREIERTEEDYLKSIEKLSQLVESKIESPTSALMANYREKLVVIDAAIADCRMQVEQNPHNAYVRQELLAMYQDKRQTLQEIAKEEKQ